MFNDSLPQAYRKTRAVLPPLLRHQAPHTLSSRRVFSGFTKAALKRGASLVVAAGLVLGGGVAAQAASPVVPDSGLVAGGERVSVPAPVGGSGPGGEVKFTQVSGGGEHSLALDSAGNAYAWGRGVSLHPGDGTIEDRHVPAQVSAGGIRFKQVSTGDFHSLAIGSDGDAYAWGWNDEGQLGDGTTEFRAAPVRVRGVNGVTFTQVSAGGEHSLALGSDGNVYAWGSNHYGQLGDGTVEDRAVPVRVRGANGVTFTQISASGEHSLALDSAGNAYAWGRSQSEQLDDESYEAVQVNAGGVRFAQVSAGYVHSLAVGTDGSVYAWGWNQQGQLGDGTTTTRANPVRVSGGSVVFTQVSASTSHSLALDEEGSVYAWGWNGLGQLGDGTTTDHSTPARLNAGGVKFTQVSTGRNHSLGLDLDGNSYAWGHNAYGQLGIGTRSLHELAPTKVDSGTRNPVGAIVVTGVAFDGQSGTTPGGAAGATAPVKNADGTWSVLTPPHAAGAVDVVVSWTLNGVAQTPVTYPGGFTYRQAAATVPPQIGPNALPKGTTGKAYTATITATGKTTPVLSLAGGTLPDGVKFDAKTGVLSGTPTKAGTFTFTISANDAGVKASKQYTITVSGSTGGPTPPSGGGTGGAKCDTPRKAAVFADTPIGHKFYDEIDWMHCMNYSTGWRQGAGKPIYKPKDQLSREAMAAFIFRMKAPKDYVAPAQSPFADVATSDTFYREIAWMSSAGLSTGWAMPSGKPLYKPKDSLSREAMAAFIFRLQASTDTKTEEYKSPQVSPFADMKADMKFYREISWMWGAGLSTGNTTAAGKEYWPKASLSREAMAAFIYRFEKKLNVADPSRSPVRLEPGAGASEDASAVKTVRVETRPGYTLSLRPLGDTSLQGVQPLTRESVVSPAGVGVSIAKNDELRLKIPAGSSDQLSIDVLVAAQGGKKEVVRYDLVIAD